MNRFPTRRGSWMGINCGDRVSDKSDLRHTGRVELVSCGLVKVRWDNGWLSFIPLENIIGAANDA